MCIRDRLLADWVEVFAPVVFQPFRPTAWPTQGSLLLDHLPFRVRALDPSGRRIPAGKVAFDVFCGVGFVAGKPRYKADAAEDIESHLASGDSPPTGVQGSHSKGQMVEQQRPLRRPGSRSEGLEHDRCKDLHPVGEQLAMTRLAQLAGLSIAPEAPPRFPGQRTGSGEAPWVLRVARAAAPSVRTSCARTLPPPAAEAR